MEDVKKSHIITENEQKSEKTTQDVQKKCLSLTEQWKKGELEEGYYYLKDNKYIFIDYFNGISFKETCDFEIKEVLAEVPDYLIWKNYVNGYCDEHEYNLKLQEENERLKKWVEEFNALNVAEENQRLKELLKECNKTFFEIRLSLSSGKINSVFDLSYQRENDINEVLK